MVSVSVTGGETQLRVEQPVSAESWPRLVALSSDVRVPNIDPSSPRWLAGVAWSVADRMRNGGDGKGRAVAIWQESKTKEPAALAVLSWHREEKGPFYLLDVGARMDLGKQTRRQLEATLLAIMLAASRQPDAGVAAEWQTTLRWATVHFAHAPHAVRRQYLEAAIRRAKKLGFERYRPPPPAPAPLAKSWLGERKFS